MSRMVGADDAGERETLLMRGALDLCVLALLAYEPLHAYGLVQELSARGFRQSSFGTIYPLVTRLRRQGLVTQRSEASPGGPARNMLSLTAEGQTALERWTRQWRSVTTRVETLLTDRDVVASEKDSHVL